MPELLVLAGVNGAGKSSVAGAYVRANGGSYFNPDEATRQIRTANPGMTEPDANSLAWQQNVAQLEDAIANRTGYAFETTLGGKTIRDLILQSSTSGFAVRIWYVGLRDIELHLTRIAARVAVGGHAIPPEKVRDRYRTSLLNLIKLIPAATELVAYDNSADADPRTGQSPQPRRVLHLERGAGMRFPLSAEDAAQTPEWAKPLVAAAWRITHERSPRG